MEAFSIFIQHWLIQENKIKRRKKAIESCSRVIQNRKKINKMETYMRRVLAGNIDYYSILNEYAYMFYSCKEPFGLCESCQLGIYRFCIDPSSTLDYNVYKIVCTHCKECWFRVAYDFVW